jgi:hypothetical protein
MEWKKMGSYKKDFEVAMFFSSQNIDFHFYLKRLLELFFFLFFSLSLFNTFSLFFSILHIFEDSGILMIFEEKDNLKKIFSNGMG